MKSLTPLDAEVISLVRKGAVTKLIRMVEAREINPDHEVVSDIGNPFTLIYSAVERSWAELVTALLRNGANPNQERNGTTPLSLACGLRNHAAIEQLLQAGADANFIPKRRGEVALFVACSKQDAWAVKRLLDAGAIATITNRNTSAIFSTVAYSRATGETEKVVRQLLSAGCPLLGNELHHPVHRREVDVVRFLLEAKCPLNSCFDKADRHGPETGETPLTTLLHLGNTSSKGDSKSREIAQLLLAAGANPNTASANGWTPLLLAVHCQEFDIAKLLFEAGANPDLVPPTPERKSSYSPAVRESPETCAKRKKLEGFVQLFSP